MINRARTIAAETIAPPAATSTAVVPASAEPAARPQRIARQEWPQDEMASMYAGIALRDLNLVDSLLSRLETMEANESDPEALDRLYRLDHLATRLRRNAENLRILAGQEIGSAATEPTSLVDVLRGAMSSIEQYTRVEINRVAALAVVDFAADDISRLLAELLDNATTHSPPTSLVTVSAHLTEQGSVLVRIEDAGIGLPPDKLRALNLRLSTNTRLDSQSIEHMGLAVVRKLAAKHGARVNLEQRPTHGTTASVLLPSALLCEAPSTPWFTEVQATPGRHRATVPSRPAMPPTALPTRRSTPSTTTQVPPRRPSPMPRSAAAQPSESSGPAPLAPAAPLPENADRDRDELDGSDRDYSDRDGGDRGRIRPDDSAGPHSSGREPGVDDSADGSADGSAGDSTDGRDTEPGLSTTRNGLPKRVPKSLRTPERTSAASRPPASAAEQEAEMRAGREQFVADLGAFSDGEQAARDSASSAAPPEGSE